MICRYATAIFLFFLLSICACPLFSAGYARATLGNGLTVIIIEDHSTDLVAVDVWVGAGSVNETKENNGVSHIIEHLLFAGSTKYQPGVVDIEAETLGASLDAHTTRDWARYSTTVAARFFPQAMNLLSEVVLHPTFPQDALQREKMVILDEIARKQSLLSKVADDALWTATAKIHPYALPIEGTPDNIKNLTRDQIQEYYNALYTSDNTTVVVVGDIFGNDVVKMIGKLFQNMPKTAKRSTIPDFTYPTSGSERTISMVGNQGTIGIGFAGPPANAYADVCAVDVLLAYLGYGYRSWMDENLVSKDNVATSSSADFLTHKYPGLLSLTLTGKNNNLEACKNKTLARLAEICRDGITDADLHKARRSMLGQFAFQNETFSGRANTYGFYDRISDVEFGDSYIERVQAVTNEDIKRVANKYMSPELANVIIIKSKD